jgi:hypothetical protein
MKQAHSNTTTIVAFICSINQSFSKYSECISKYSCKILSNRAPKVKQNKQESTFLSYICMQVYHTEFDQDHSSSFNVAVFLNV